RPPQIEVVLAREREIAAESLRQGNKQRALIALRQKKYQETLLSQTDSQLETLQKLVQSIEYSLVEKDVLYGLKQGSEVLKQLNKEMDLATVEKLMDDTREGIAYQEEVSALLSSRISAQDEEDVLAELAAMQAEQTSTKLPEAPSHALPEVERPAASIDAEEQEEEEGREAEPARWLVSCCTTPSVYLSVCTRAVVGACIAFPTCASSAPADPLLIPLVRSTRRRLTLAPSRCSMLAPGVQYQLSQIKLGLAKDPSNTELQTLKSELEDLISLTRQFLGANAAPAPPPAASSSAAARAPAAASASASPAPRPTAPAGKASPAAGRPATLAGAPSSASAQQHKFATGDDCSCRYSDGKWYPARITSITGSADQPIYTVVYRGYDTPEVVSASSKAKSWQSFAKKGTKKGVHIPGVAGGSMFRSPDDGNPNAKVGVVGGGRGVTQNQQRKRQTFQEGGDD
ncbi:polyketide synthase, partial [Rhodotorula diobovata]